MGYENTARQRLEKHGTGTPGPGSRTLFMEGKVVHLGKEEKRVNRAEEPGPPGTERNTGDGGRGHAPWEISGMPSEFNDLRTKYREALKIVKEHNKQISRICSTNEILGKGIQKSSQLFSENTTNAEIAYHKKETDKYIIHLREAEKAFRLFEGQIRVLRSSIEDKIYVGWDRHREGMPPGLPTQDGEILRVAGLASGRSYETEELKDRLTMIQDWRKHNEPFIREDLNNEDIEKLDNLQKSTEDLLDKYERIGKGEDKDAIGKAEKEFKEAATEFMQYTHEKLRFTLKENELRKVGKGKSVGYGHFPKRDDDIIKKAVDDIIKKAEEEGLRYFRRTFNLDFSGQDNPSIWIYDPPSLSELSKKYRPVLEKAGWLKSTDSLEEPATLDAIVKKMNQELVHHEQNQELYNFVTTAFADVTSPGRSDILREGIPKEKWFRLPPGVLAGPIPYTTLQQFFDRYDVHKDDREAWKQAYETVSYSGS